MVQKSRNSLSKRLSIGTAHSCNVRWQFDQLGHQAAVYKVSVEMSPRLDDISARRPPQHNCECFPDQLREWNSDLDIVIYEENQLTRNLLREWLGQAGYRVRNGALREPCRCPTDLVIASVYMPKHFGSGWVRTIKAAHPRIPLIAISGQFRSGLCPYGATAQGLGVQHVIAKPLIRAELLAAVRGIIGTPPDAHEATNALNS